MSKILMGFLSAHHPSRWGYRARARKQYLKDSPLPYVFVLGHPGAPEKGEEKYRDILYVDCPDEKEYMVLKNQALFRYALDAGFDYCFRACDDTWVFPDRIRDAGFEEFDYAGQMPCKFSLGGTFKIWMRYYDYMHGGTGIWLSRKAMELLVADEWKGPDWVSSMPPTIDVGMGLMLSRPPVYWDDHWIGEVLKGNLPWDSPKREHPAMAYAENGINIYEDDLMFFNDDQDRPVAIHDPGVRKMQSWQAVAIQNKVKEWKGKIFGNLKITETK